MTRSFSGMKPNCTAKYKIVPAPHAESVGI